MEWMKHHPKTNEYSHETWWLEDYFPFEMVKNQEVPSGKWSRSWLEYPLIFK